MDLAAAARAAEASEAAALDGALRLLRRLRRGSFALAGVADRMPWAVGAMAPPAALAFVEDVAEFSIEVDSANALLRTLRTSIRDGQGHVPDLDGVARVELSMALPSDADAGPIRGGSCGAQEDVANGYSLAPAVGVRAWFAKAEGQTPLNSELWTRDEFVDWMRSATAAAAAAAATPGGRGRKSFDGNGEATDAAAAENRSLEALWLKEQPPPPRGADSARGAAKQGDNICVFQGSYLTSWGSRVVVAASGEVLLEQQEAEGEAPTLEHLFICTDLRTQGSACLVDRAPEVDRGSRRRTCRCRLVAGQPGRSLLWELQCICGGKSRGGIHALASASVEAGLPLAWVPMAAEGGDCFQVAADVVGRLAAVASRGVVLQGEGKNASARVPPPSPPMMARSARGERENEEALDAIHGGRSTAAPQQRRAATPSPSPSPRGASAPPGLPSEECGGLLLRNQGGASGNSPAGGGAAGAGGGGGAAAEGGRRTSRGRRSCRTPPCAADVAGAGGASASGAAVAEVAAERGAGDGQQGDDGEDAVCHSRSRRRSLTEGATLLALAANKVMEQQQTGGFSPRDIPEDWVLSTDFRNAVRYPAALPSRADFNLRRPPRPVSLERSAAAAAGAGGDASYGDDGKDFAAEAGAADADGEEEDAQLLAGGGAHAEALEAPRPRRRRTPSSSSRSASQSRAPSLSRPQSRDARSRPSRGSTGGGNVVRARSLALPSRTPPAAAWDRNSLRLQRNALFSSSLAAWRAANGHASSAPARRPGPGTCAAYVRKRPLIERDARGRDFDALTVIRDAAGAGSARLSQEIVHHACLFDKSCSPYICHTRFPFDGVFDTDATNEDVYDAVGRPLLEAALNGNLATLFLFGQTGSGKTHTMRAIERLVVDELFEHQRTSGATLSLAYFELQGRKALDLLTPHRCEVRLREEENGCFRPHACEEVVVSDPEEMLKLLEEAAGRRATDATAVHAASSRSHAVCRISVSRPGSSSSSAAAAPSSAVSGQLPGVGQLLLVDCAGTERSRDTLYFKGQHQRESAEINSSLFALKDCLRTRQSAVNRQDSLGSDGTLRLPSARASTLTKVLAESLSSTSARLAAIATVSSNATDCEHTVETLRSIFTLSGRGEAQIVEVRQAIE
eukprot:TRINITY_DN9456_c0_g2_i1.p1 TRINITY_DN9456_c0_g2~~TRINITY_DN9456_c0_g2_i1.p1  ORF type:complete len:1138 (+),score=277.40 TRINITY_DN9456_c0_g2_i1:1-3414(+)